MYERTWRWVNSIFLVQLRKRTYLGCIRCEEREAVSNMRVKLAKHE
jgi:hypothetical protein